MSVERDSNRAGEGFWTYGRVALTAFVLLGVLFAVSTCDRGGPSSPAGEKAEPRALPSSVLNAQIWDLEGKVFRLSDYGGKVLVLDIWATWCGPCREEIPHLTALRSEYGPRGLEVVGLTVEDPVSEFRTVRDFARDFPVSYRVGWAAPEWTLKLTGGNEAIPQTFVIGRDGRTYLHATGFSERTARLLRAAIEEALAAE